MVYQIFPEMHISEINEQLSVFLAKFVLRMHRNCYFWGFVKSSDIAIRFSDHDFLQESNALAIT